MCILTVATHAHPDFPLVLTHNRDEYFAREATSLATQDDLLCARDRASGGTWMGLNVESGRFASLTNVRCKPPSGVRSRGELVSRTLHGDDTALESTEYAAYNLLHGVLDRDMEEPLRLTASAPPSWTPLTTELPAGMNVAAKSNDHFGDLTFGEAIDEADTQRTWPKVAWLRTQVEAALAEGAELAGEEGARALIGALGPAMSAHFMSDAFQTAADAFLPSDVSPLSVEHERRLQQAPCIRPFAMHGPYAPASCAMYGTVSQSVLIVCRSEDCALYAYRELPIENPATRAGDEEGAGVQEKSALPEPEWSWRRVPLPAAPISTRAPHRPMQVPPEAPPATAQQQVGGGAGDDPESPSQPCGRKRKASDSEDAQEEPV